MKTKMDFVVVGEKNESDAYQSPSGRATLSGGSDACEQYRWNYHIQIGIFVYWKSSWLVRKFAFSGDNRIFYR